MDNVKFSSPQSTGLSPLRETVLSTCDGYTYTQLLDNGYGLTPITPSNSAETSFRTPIRTQSVKRRLNLEEGGIDDEGFRTPIKTPKRSRQKAESTHYIPGSSPSRQRNISPAKGSRYDTSLGKLTKEFVFLLQSANDGTVNLNKACETLNVQKRRIYDITNVLEGIGLVIKKSKNNVQWTSSQEESSELEKSLRDLEAKENELDSLIESAERDLLQMSQDKKFAYITYQDLHSIKEYKDHTVFAVKAPPGTQLQVPQDVQEKNYKIHLKSEGSPIEVFLSESSGVESTNNCKVGNDENISPTSEISSSMVFKSQSSKKPILKTLQKEPPSPSIEKFIKTEILKSPDPFGKGFSFTMSSDSFSSPTMNTASLGIENKFSSPHLQNEVEDDLFEPSTSPPPFLSLEPPLSDSDYTFSLDHTEGLSDLFDFNFSY